MLFSAIQYSQLFPTDCIFVFSNHALSRQPTRWPICGCSLTSKPEAFVARENGHAHVYTSQISETMVNWVSPCFLRFQIETWCKGPQGWSLYRPLSKSKFFCFFVLGNRREPWGTIQRNLNDSFRFVSLRLFGSLNFSPTCQGEPWEAEGTLHGPGAWSPWWAGVDISQQKHFWMFWLRFRVRFRRRSAFFQGFSEKTHSGSLW